MSEPYDNPSEIIVMCGGRKKKINYQKLVAYLIYSAGCTNFAWTKNILIIFLPYINCCQFYLGFVRRTDEKI